jgi:hypothetical protein
LHYLHNNVLVIDQSEYIEDRPVPEPFPAFPMTKREKLWERGCQSIRNSDIFQIPTCEIYLKLQTGSPNYQKFTDTFEILYTSNIIKTAETGSPKYQKF